MDKKNRIKTFLYDYYFDALSIDEQLHFLDRVYYHFYEKDMLKWRIKKFSKVWKRIELCLQKIKELSDKTKREVERVKKQKHSKVRISKHALHRLNQRYPTKSKFTKQAITKDIFNNWQRIRSNWDWTYKIKTGERTYIISRDLVVITIY